MPFPGRDGSGPSASPQPGHSILGIAAVSELEELVGDRLPGRALVQARQAHLDAVLPLVRAVAVTELVGAAVLVRIRERLTARTATCSLTVSPVAWSNQSICTVSPKLAAPRKGRRDPRRWSRGAEGRRSRPAACRPGRGTAPAQPAGTEAVARRERDDRRRQPRLGGRRPGRRDVARGRAAGCHAHSPAAAQPSRTGPAAATSGETRPANASKLAANFSASFAARTS